MKKFIFTLAIFFFAISITKSQIVDLSYPAPSDSTKNEDKAVEILGKSFFDIFTNGNLQGTAQLLKINIGEPDGFNVPIFFLAGASGNGFSLESDKKNENTISNLLNPIGGLFNGTWMGFYPFHTSKSGITSLKVSVQISTKLLTADDSVSNDSEFLLSGYGNLGVFFQTGAWESTDKNNIGVFWIQAKAAASVFFSGGDLKNIFGSALESKNFIGYSVDGGLAINKRINLKFGIYQYVNNQSLEILKKPVWKFSFDYNLKK